MGLVGKSGPGPTQLVACLCTVSGNGSSAILRPVGVEDVVEISPCCNALVLCCRHDLLVKLAVDADHASSVLFRRWC